jgi:hypothetical protein
MITTLTFCKIGRYIDIQKLMLFTALLQMEQGGNQLSTISTARRILAPQVEQRFHPTDPLVL